MLRSMQLRIVCIGQQEMVKRNLGENRVVETLSSACSEPTNHARCWSGVTA